MYKKIYSLLAGLILLSACTAEETWNDKDIVPTIENETSVTFSMNIPTATQTKSDTAEDAELAVIEGVKNLRLFTFDSDDLFIAEVEPKSQTVGYKAVIDKKTASIHFIANFGTEDLGLEAGVSSVDDLIHIETSQYLFWGKADFSHLTNVNEVPIVYDDEAGNSDLGIIDLYRNWAMFSLSVDAEVDNLLDVHYMIYNRATNSRVGVVTDKEINTPDNATFVDDDNFVVAGKNIYPFENSNNNKQNPTFIIIQAKYGNDINPSYYKLDLSSKDEESGNTVIHNVIRNHLYNVTIEGVAMAGVTWDEVTHPDKLPDNNITAAIELDDYPKISYEEETLEVEKTTFVFTEHSDPYELSMWANYNLGNEHIKIVPDDIKNVIDGDIDNDNNGNIWADLLPIDLNSYKEGSFYVVAGKLQRKVKIVLRKAYSFEFEAVSNPVWGVQGTDITLKFRMSEEPDASIFPLDCKIRTTKLYAVEDGVRIQTNGDGTYDYIYTAKEYQNEYSLAFKTNSSNSDEQISLSAEYFNTKTLEITTIEFPFAVFTPSGTYRYAALASNTGSLISGKTVYVNYESDSQEPGEVSFETTDGRNGGSANSQITIPKDADNIVLRYTDEDEICYYLSVSLVDLQSTENKKLIQEVKILTIEPAGIFRYQTGKILGTRFYANITGTVTVVYDGGSTLFEVNNGTAQGTFELPSNISSVTLSFYDSVNNKTCSRVRTVTEITGTGNKELRYN